MVCSWDCENGLEGGKGLDVKVMVELGGWKAGRVIF